MCVTWRRKLQCQSELCCQCSVPFSDHACLGVLSLSPGEETAVWQCLTILEEGLSHSPSNAQFKLLLIRIYCRLGAFEPVAELYSSLDAKHIQHDTIGWVVYTENNWWWWPSSNQSWGLQFPLLLKVNRLSDFHTALCKSVLELHETYLLKYTPLLMEYLSCVIFDQFWIFRVLTKGESERNLWNVYLDASHSLVFWEH